MRDGHPGSSGSVRSLERSSRCRHGSVCGGRDVLYRGPDGAMLFSVQLAVYLALIPPALLTAFIGVMGFVQLHFDPGAHA